MQISARLKQKQCHLNTNTRERQARLESRVATAKNENLNLSNPRYREDKTRRLERLSAIVYGIHGIRMEHCEPRGPLHSGTNTVFTECKSSELEVNERICIDSSTIFVIINISKNYHTFLEQTRN